jgi:putative membrane protein
MEFGSERRFLRVLGALFAFVWAALAIAPVDRHVWMLENFLTLIGAAMMFGSYFRFPLSRFSYASIFVFGVLHSWGAHHTYSLVPYDAWSRALLGISIDEVFGFERNQYDRFIHLLWGLLLAYPARELFVRMARVRGFWGYAFPQLLVMASSVVYEMIEWFAAVVFGGELGMQYLGTQGDEWDGHKDMALASLGSLVAMTIVAVVNAITQPGFRAEWRASLSARDTAPLGDRVLLERMRARRSANR